MEIQTEPTRGIVEYLRLNIPLILTSEAKQKWVRYVDANSNSAEGIKLLSDVANMLFKVQKGESIDKLEKELVEINPNYKTMVSTVFRTFAEDVLVDLNKPTYQEDYSVTTEVPEDERIVPSGEEVTMEVPEDERIEELNPSKIAKEMFEYMKRPDVTSSDLEDFLNIYARLKGAPCETEETSLNDIVTYKGNKTIRRSALTNILISNNCLELAKMVLNDPQALEDAMLNSRKAEQAERQSELEQRFINNRYLDEEGNPIPIPKVPKM